MISRRHTTQKGIALGTLLLPIAMASMGMLMTQMASSVQKNLQVKKREIKRRNLLEIGQYRNMIEDELEKSCDAYLVGEPLQGDLSQTKIDLLTSKFPPPNSLSIHSIRIETAKLGHQRFDENVHYNDPPIPIPDSFHSFAEFGYIRGEIRFEQELFGITHGNGKEIFKRKFYLLGIPDDTLTFINDCTAHGTPEAAAAYTHSPCFTNNHNGTGRTLDDCVDNQQPYLAMLVNICSHFGELDVPGCDPAGSAQFCVNGGTGFYEPTVCDEWEDQIAAGNYTNPGGTNPDPSYPYRLPHNYNLFKTYVYGGPHARQRYVYHRNNP